ncbi:MAG TPA: transcription antitermination factor NusB [Burkholderiaceae bacterium]|nr:transcription antitermination factor NusB [Burkholderiaceae bacterium]
MPKAPTEAAGASGRGSSRSARRRARELAVQGLYQWLVGGQDAAAIESHLAETRGRQGLEELAARADMEHYRGLLNGVIDGAPELRADFAPHLDRGVDALSPVEHCILLLATYELKYRAEIPYRVVINEAVELAKSFGGTDGFKYVNGVLDKVAAQLRAAEVAARA